MIRVLLFSLFLSSYIYYAHGNDGDNNNKKNCSKGFRNSTQSEDARVESKNTATSSSRSRRTMHRMMEQFFRGERAPESVPETARSAEEAAQLEQAFTDTSAEQTKTSIDTPTSKTGARSRASRVNVRRIRPAQARNLTAEELQSLRPRAVRRIQAYLTPEQISWLNREQVKGLLIKQLSLKQVEALTEAQLPSLRSKDFRLVQAVLSERSRSTSEAKEVESVQVRSSTTDSKDSQQVETAKQQLPDVLDKVLSGETTLTREEIKTLVENLNKSEVQSVSPENIRKMQEQGYLSLEQIPMLTEAQIGRLDFSELTSDQFLRFTLNQFHWVNPQNIHYIQKYLTHLSALIPDQFKALDFGELTPEQMQTISVAQVQLIPPRDIKTVQSMLVTKDISRLNEEQIKELDLDQLTAEQAQALTNKQSESESVAQASVDPVAPESPSPPPPAIRATVAAPQQTGTRASQRSGRVRVRFLSNNQRQVERFTAEELQNMRPGVVRNIQDKLSPEQISWLKPEQVRRLNFGELTLEQVQALTEAQVQAIPSKKIRDVQDKLLPEQMAWFGLEQVRNLDFIKMTAPQVQALNEAQVQAIPHKSITAIQRNLSPQQIYWLKEEQVSQLYTGQLTVEQLHALVRAQSQVQAIPETGIRDIQDKLLPEQVAWLSEKQLEQVDLNLLNKEQTQMLSEEQLSWNSLLSAMPTKQVENLTNDQLGSVASNPTAVPSSRPFRIENRAPVPKLHLIQDKLSSQQVTELINNGKLEVLSIELLTRDQINGLDIQVFKQIGVQKLSVGQWKQVKEDKVQNLTEKELNDLNTERLHAIQRHLLPEQIVGLKEEHLENLYTSTLTPAQVKALSEKSLIRFLPRLLNARQLAQLTHIDTLPVSELNKFNTSQLRAIQARLTPTQLNGLKKKLFETLSFELLTLEQVAGLNSRYLSIVQSKVNSELIPALERFVTDFNMKFTTVAQTQAMTVEQLQSVLNKLSRRQIRVLTNEQVTDLLEESVELSSKQLKYLGRNLSVHQISQLSEVHKERLGFKGFSNAAQFRQMTASEADSLTPRAVKRLVRSTPEMAHILSADQLNSLNRRRLRRIQQFLLPEQIASLTNGKAKLLNVKLLTAVQIQALTVQLEYFSKFQLRSIQTHLSPEQIAGVSPHTLSKLVLKKLSKPQVEAITTSQLERLGYRTVYPIWDKLLPEQQEQLQEWQPAIRRS